MGMRNTDKYMTFDTLIDSPEMRWNTKKPFILKLSLHVHIYMKAMAGHGQWPWRNECEFANCNTYKYKSTVEFEYYSIQELFLQLQVEHF